MALRVRPRAPQDENAAHPLLAGKLQGNNGGGLQTAGKAGGLKLQQQNQQGSNHPERKTLSNITNKLPNSQTPNPALKPSSGSENLISKTGSSSSLKKPTGSARIALRNITNENSTAGPSPSTAPVKDVVKQMKPKSGLGLSKSDAPKLGPKIYPPLSQEMKRNADLWAKDGIEHMHFSGDDMEALRLKLEDEEIEKRVNASLAYRMQLPRFFPQHSEPIKEIGDVLEPVPCGPFVEKDDFATPFTGDDLNEKDILGCNCSILEIPRIPDNWRLIGEEDLHDI
ncbi:hypothetical protein CY35_07G081300 [Sphagnum magellanicum]|uniref:Uncharacterized protein n=2 Tax=Sphagnum magellanicum TaxID=128215 RepID=A0ACB8HMG1_9BRYO|nr:hypothetical protein CY35_07G081300 [Sphagnum magellanicum]KAH9557351.1 hypothetical protein CY35_07G081300 [Sphagnum magellanicum]